MRKIIPYGHLVQEYYVKKLRELAEKRAKERALVKTRPQAEKLVRSVRKKIQRCFGVAPKRTPLNPRITGIIDRKTYRVEKLIFDSRPDFQVTANLDRKSVV